MTTSCTTSIEQDVRARRLWYNDIQITPDIRTRFVEDYDANPVLRAVDANNRTMIDWLGSRLPDSLDGSSVLDVGCADGLYSFWAARRGADRVLGVERNRYNWERAEWLRGVIDADRVEFVHGSLERHVPSETFDYVFCLSLLYHLVDPLGALRQLRRRCRRAMILVTAIDLPEGDGSPMSRLDRYATGAHGVWSFNTAMVRQLLSTAGFDAKEEAFKRLGETGGRYTALCVPGDVGQHHIFDDRIDQEFPINIEKRRDQVRAAWMRLAEKIKRPIAVFGAGTHTPWLLEQVRDISGVRVSCIMDDRIPLNPVVAGLPVRRPTDVDVEALDAVVISSWHQQDVLIRRAKELYGDRVAIVALTGSLEAQ